MAVPTTKATFKSYCLRALGFGVIDINISDDQADDRIDEALQYFSQYHYDGIERMYLKHLITTADVARARSNATTTATDKLDSTLTADWLEGKNWIPVPDTVLAVVKVFPFSDTSSRSSLFDVRYTDVYDDIYLKRYATALLKRQWGANLSKFSGVAMLGGVTMNGETIFTQAQEELQKLEEQIQLAYELPVNYMIG